jgi:phosphatidylglycerophosphatase A
MSKKILSGLKFIGTLIPVGLFFFAHNSLAALPSGTPITLDYIERIINVLANWIVAMSMVFAIIWFVWAGIKYMIAGSNDTKVEEARKMLWTGVIGTMIILGIGVILNTIMYVINGCFFFSGLGC